MRHLIPVEANDQGYGRRQPPDGPPGGGRGAWIQPHVVPCIPGRGIDRGELEQHHLAGAHGALEAPDAGIDAHPGWQEAGRQETKASRCGIPPMKGLVPERRRATGRRKPGSADEEPIGKKTGRLMRLSPCRGSSSRWRVPEQQGARAQQQPGLGHQGQPQIVGNRGSQPSSSGTARVMSARLPP